MDRIPVSRDVCATIAKSTVTTHRKSIYRKLGVHTQQQLLSVVDGEDPSLHER